MTAPLRLTGPLIEAFSGTFLSGRYDDPVPTPSFHRECWSLYASEVPNCGIAAPRDHAKSTALTFDFTLAAVCFRAFDYVIIIGSTEEKAAEQLSNISDELHNNKDLLEEFEIAGFETDQKTDIIVTCRDGHRFRIIARGAEQKIRGAMWNGKRPNLIVCDDMEDDEQVESKERRRKFRKWFFRAAKQSLSKKGKIRVHGTILHEDSLLSRLAKNKMWTFKVYRAHRSYDDFSEILWPARWNEQQLRDKRTEFEEDGDSTGYAQEFLNDPHDRSDSYLKEHQFRGMSAEEKDAPKLYYAGADFAISKADNANRTSFTVGGRMVGGITAVVNQQVDRWDTLEWIKEMFYIQLRWNIQVWFVEDGSIWKSVAPLIYQEMLGDTRSPPMRQEFGGKDIYLNLEPLTPVKDKGVRGRSFQKRMKAGTMRFDRESEWFEPYKEECLRFTGVAQARLDDQFDSSATLCIGLDRLPPMTDEDLVDSQVQEEDPDEVEVEERSYYAQHGGFQVDGRSRVTGY
jgi:hypothetical protein